MANITFRSPVMAKDITVYAVAGERGSLLSLAKAHKIPIPFDCGDGECGSYLIEVTRIAEGERMGVNMQEKEKGDAAPTRQDHARGDHQRRGKRRAVALSPRLPVHRRQRGYPGVLRGR